MKKVLLCVIAGAWLSCGTTMPRPDGGNQPLDAGPDAGNVAPDGGDAGEPDAGPPDAGHHDAGTPDSGFDAGPGDAGSHDGGPDGGVGDGGDAGNQDAGCPYAYCDDFDSYTPGPIANAAHLGPWLATMTGKHLTLSIAASGGYDGTQALRIQIAVVPDGGSARGTLNQRTADGGALVGSNLFGRAEIFYATDGDAGLPLGVHSWLFNAAGKTPAGGTTSMNMGGGGEKAQLNYQYPKQPDGGPYRLPDGGDMYPTEASIQGGSLTADAWHCLQWQYQGPPANVGNVWIDGTEVITVNDPTVKNWILSDAYDSFDLGFTHYQELTNGIDVYLDDFALDGQMVPCP